MRHQHSKDVPAFKQWTSKDCETVKEGKKGQRNGPDQGQGQAPAMSKTDDKCFCGTGRGALISPEYFPTPPGALLSLFCPGLTL